MWSAVDTGHLACLGTPPPSQHGHLPVPAKVGRVQRISLECSVKDQPGLNQAAA